MNHIGEQSIEKDYTKSLAQYIGGFSYEDMPPEVVARAKIILLDTLGAILPASDPAYPGSRALIEMARMLGGEPQSTIIGSDFKTSSINACLVNGTFGYAFDIEPHHVAAVLHPAAVCIPVALAFTEWKKRGGKDLLSALTLGIEVSCRVSMALNPRDLYGRGFHPTSIACTFGAAASAGHLLQLKEDQWLNALGLSGNQASGLLAWAKDHTENSRPLNPGLAARNGATASLLAKLGFGGPPNIFDGKYDFFSAFSSGGQNPEHFFRDEWAVQELAIKQYSSCSFTHPGLDALLEIIEEHGLVSKNIAKIDLRYPRAGAHMIDNNELRSHCAQYVFAVAAVTGQVLFDDILTDRRDDPEIKRLFENASLIPDDILDRTYPDQYESIVTVTTTDGRSFEKHSGWAKGTVQNPMTENEVEDKFFKLSTRRIPVEQAEQIRSWVATCEALEDVEGLMALLRVV
ncbi:MAG TPA: MmgE/PrpD family protein [Deltaproteobacteria bacterium]|nr:MmgE/PrpD family protein [Deltaproteobacteria bacterium]